MLPSPVPVSIDRLSKRFGSVQAVDSLSFDVSPGRVTGFLGLNGSGKTTTLRMLLGLVRPDAGTARIGGRAYAELPDPLRTVGASLEASSFHAGRTARDHLRVLAAAAGIPDSRIDAVLAQVGLGDAARRRVGGFSLGMRQRLNLASALLGDPAVLLLDEPTNGLDPQGIAWLRGFLRHLASEGRTVLVSSHLLREVEQTVDDVVIIHRGRLVWRGDLAAASGDATVTVTTPSPEALLQVLTSAGLDARPSGADRPHELLVAAAGAPQVGHLAFTAGVELHGLVGSGGLECLFLRLVKEES
ncbi:MAG: ABC transporter ATP-binding protein [Kineosporiaceae bacterium]